MARRNDWLRGQVEDCAQDKQQPQLLMSNDPQRNQPKATGKEQSDSQIEPKGLSSEPPFPPLLRINARSDGSCGGYYLLPGPLLQSQEITHKLKHFLLIASALLQQLLRAQCQAAASGLPGCAKVTLQQEEEHPEVFLQPC